MLLRTILNSIHPIKGFVYGAVRFRGTGDFKALIIRLRPRLGSKGRCPHCMMKCPGYDKQAYRLFQFIPLWNIPVYLEYSRRRLDCPTHGVVVEYLPWVEGKSHSTTAFQIFLSEWARLLSWQEVARRFHTSWDNVWESVKKVVDYGLKHRKLTGVGAIGVDELCIGNGQDYVTLVYQIDQGVRRLLWIGKDRCEKTLSGFFEMLGTELSSQIEYVCSDMWRPYLNVIARYIPQALNILDRFHIMKKFGEAIDLVRANETARLEKDGYEPVLNKSRWILLKRPSNLTDKQKSRLSTLLEYNLLTVQAYLLKEDFQQFWKYTSPTWAKKFLDGWIESVMASKIEPFKKVAKMLSRHEPLIMNWFKAKGTMSSGIVEALNNTAKMTIRKSYGFREYKSIEYALYHKLGDLPVPNLTHSFF